MRFTYLVRKRTVPPTAALQAEAENCLIRCTQRELLPDEVAATRNDEKPPASSKLSSFKSFLDENSILRVQTRLTESSTFTYEESNPIVIPGESRMAVLLILQTHRINAHFGVSTVLNRIRRRFWITRARQTIKTLLRKCVTCRRRHGLSAGQVEAPLPSERITMIAPFATTGLDFCGPFWVQTLDGPKKVYVALFTCSATRGIHLELVCSMATPQTHLAIRRFLATYPTCSLFVSDNARSFVRAATDIKKLFNTSRDPSVKDLLAERRIEWQFICPRAPWHGGFYERLVGTVKHALAKTLGRSLISFEEFRTVIYELAAVVNDRPITPQLIPTNSPP